MAIDFIDLKSQQARLKDDIDRRIAAVLAHGRYVMGPEVSEFEERLAAFGEARYALGCANGTDAILLPLMAWDIGPSDAVFCPSFTYCATAEVVALRRATPVFVDIERDTYNMCPASLRQAIQGVIEKGELTPKAVIVVDLFGQCADYEALAPVAREFGLKLIADSAQGFGSTLNGKHPLHWADITTTSFFPAKPLGCYGDGGAILTNDEALMQTIDSLRIHGKGTDKYDNIHIGLNSRLDSLQAAILLAKIDIFAEEIQTRNDIARRYSDGLRGSVNSVPAVKDGVISTWAQYTIEIDDPDSLSTALREKDIPSARYYPTPIHLQTAYKHFPVAGNGLPNTEAAMTKLISLPMSAYIDHAVQDKIIGAVKKFKR